MERKHVYDPVMPSPTPFISFIAPGHLDTDVYTRHIQHARTHLHLHTTYVSFLGTVRAVPLVLLAYLAFSMNSGTAIIVASISY